MERLIQILKDKNLTISTCESCTGGLFASEITAISGVSAVYKGSLVSYSSSIKRDILKIDERMIENYGLVSKEVASAMAKQGNILFKTDVCVSFTGNAGPDVCDDKPVGRVCCAIDYLNQQTSFELDIVGDRNQIREQAVLMMIEEVIKLLVV